jgi:hypothetical protein
VEGVAGAGHDDPGRVRRRHLLRERHFWDVRRADRAIEIDLAGVPYDRLVVEVADPDAALAQLA